MNREITSLACVLVLLLPLFVGHQPPPPPAVNPANPEPLWWEIRLELRAEGEYRTQEGETGYSGEYRLDILWTGTIERDADDYRLFHAHSKVLHWEAKERAISPQSTKTLTTREFAICPEFKMLYILKKEARLHLAFFVAGFPAPRNDSTDKYFIALPASEENDQNSSESDYGSFITRGSNRICLEERDIFKPDLEKKFNWSWKHEQWLQRQKRTVLFANQHWAEVKISIESHYK